MLCEISTSCVPCVDPIEDPHAHADHLDRINAYGACGYRAPNRHHRLPKRRPSPLTALLPKCWPITSWPPRKTAPNSLNLPFKAIRSPSRRFLPASTKSCIVALLSAVTGLSCTLGWGPARRAWSPECELVLITRRQKRTCYPCSGMRLAPVAIRFWNDRARRRRASK